MSDPVQFTQKHSDDEPYNNFTYKVEINSVSIGGFNDIDGLGVTADVLEYQEGGVHDITHTFQNDLSYSNVKLQRGMTKHDDFIKWITNSVNSSQKNTQFDVMITMKNREDISTKGWKLINSHPVRWEGPNLASDDSGIAMSLIELTYEELDLISY